MEPNRIWDESSWQTRIINMTELGKVLKGDFSPPIKGLFVYNANPAATVPDQNAVLTGLGAKTCLRSFSIRS